MALDDSLAVTLQVDTSFPSPRPSPPRERENISQSKGKVTISEFLESANEGSLSLGRGPG